MIVLENISKRFRIPHERTRTLFHKVLSSTKSGYSYEDFYAVKDVDLQVRPGEFLSIIGRNGAGKSTLLRIMAGVYRPTAGTIRVNEAISPLLELGLGFDNNFSCKENIYVYGAILGFERSDISRRLDHILAFAELERFADTKLENLSSGMRVRLAFSIAIQSVAPVILVDEVMAVGDMVFNKKCKDVFKTFKSEGRTIVFVSHAMNLVQEFSDRVCVMNNGQLINDGAPAEMIEYYNSKDFPHV